MSEVIVGIDLGTTQSAIAVVDSGFPILLADEMGRTLTPSAVWYGRDGEVEVGHEALRRAEVDRVVTSVKSLIGRRASDGKGELSSDGKLETLAGLRSPEEVSAEILGHLKEV
ncbi:MAG: molecular chaperone DnaK, partial [Akkermansiaceae bacterium]